MMNWITKADKGWLGFLIGLITPFFIFFCYWLFFHHNITFPKRFLRFLMGGYLLSNVVKICALFNLLLFYGGLHFKLDRFNRGVIFSIIVYVGVIAYITYYLEPEYI